MSRRLPFGFLDRHLFAFVQLLAASTVQGTVLGPTPPPTLFASANVQLTLFSVHRNTNPLGLRFDADIFGPDRPTFKS